MNHELKTKVYIIIDNKTPIKTELRFPHPGNITLAHFKSATGLRSPNYRYFFKSSDPEFGIAKEEITDDDARLPLFRGQVVAVVITNKDAIYEDIGNDRHDYVSHDTYDESSVGLTTDSEASSYFNSESDDDRTSCSYSNYSHSTHNTSVSQLQHHRGGVGGGHHDGHHQARYGSTTTGGSTYQSLANGSARRVNESSSMSSISDVTAYQEVVVQLLLTPYNFLGLSVRGQSDRDGNDRLYVGDIKEDSVVAQCGRIEPGDLLLQVNDTSIVGKSNEDAVQVLKDAVSRRGHLKLVVAKCLDVRPLANDDAIHPIDLNAWVAHTQAMTEQEQQVPVDTATTNRLPVHTSSTTSSPSFGSCFMDSDCVQLATSCRVSLDKDKTDMKVIVQQMSAPDSGLEIKDREWLKIPIAKAFLGSGLIGWLQRNVSGCQDRREARKYASTLLNSQHIRGPIWKKSFSEKCYYVFVEPT